MNLERFLRRAAIQLVGFLAVLSICPSLVHSQDRPRLTGDLPSEISPKKVADVLANAKIFRWNEKVNIYVENFDRQNKRSRDCTVARTGADLEWLQQQTTFQFGFTDNQSVANFLIATSDSEESEALVQEIINEKVRTTHPLHMFFYSSEQEFNNELRYHLLGTGSRAYYDANRTHVAIFVSDDRSIRFAYIWFRASDITGEAARQRDIYTSEDFQNCAHPIYDIFFSARLFWALGITELLRLTRLSNGLPAYLERELAILVFKSLYQSHFTLDGSPSAQHKAIEESLKKFWPLAEKR
ncbi:MAG: hypothetical protein J5I90_06535 [Caldilineales bacterium]|nr:hypothetical protein [Caldilineales bacterium]